MIDDKNHHHGSGRWITRESAFHIEEKLCERLRGIKGKVSGGGVSGGCHSAGAGESRAGERGMTVNTAEKIMRGL